MKRPYQHPLMQVLPIPRAVLMLAASPLVEVETEPGGDIDPGTEVDTGLARDFDFTDFNDLNF